MKWKMAKLKGRVDNSISVVGDFTTILTIMSRTSREKMRKGVNDLNNIIEHVDVTEIYKAHYPKARE